MTNKNLTKEIEELKAKLDKLQEDHDFLIAAVDHLPNPIFMKDEDGKFFFFNRSYADFFNMKQSKYIGKTVLELDYLPIESRQRFHRDAMRLIENRELTTYDANFVSDEGVDRPSFYWSCGFQDEVTGKAGLVGEIVDISKERNLQKSLDQSLEELKESNEKLQVMVETDQASGLYNRTVIWSKGKEMIRKGEQAGQHTCLIMIDLDHFKRINDQFGHIKGDEILRDFSCILRSESRASDLPIRYGGDEFLLILQDIELEDAAGVAERIRVRCEGELKVPDGSPVTASIGVIQVDAAEEFEENLRRLDKYLYRAKSQGRNQIVT